VGWCSGYRAETAGECPQASRLDAHAWHLEPPAVHDLRGKEYGDRLPGPGGDGPATGAAKRFPAQTRLQDGEGGLAGSFWCPKRERPPRAVSESRSGIRHASGLRRVPEWPLWHLWCPG